MRGKGHTWHQDMPRTLSHSDHHLNTELSVPQLGPYPLSDLISYHLPPSPAPATSASLLVLWHAQALASGPLHLLTSLPGRLFHTVHSLIFPSLITVMFFVRPSLTTLFNSLHLTSLLPCFIFLHSTYFSSGPICLSPCISNLLLHKKSLQNLEA